MNANFGHGSAKIYQFPVKRAVGIARNETQEPVSYLGVNRICDAAIGSSWYHDEAVREEDKARHTIVPLIFPRQ